MIKVVTENVDNPNEANPVAEAPLRNYLEVKDLPKFSDRAYLSVVSGPFEKRAFGLFLEGSPGSRPLAKISLVRREGSTGRTVYNYWLEELLEKPQEQNDFTVRAERSGAFNLALKELDLI